ncbi:MAG: N-methyl-L-tryptophan oxidase [Phycisphaerales bacterium]|nr:N-methyl-L-tryptophan oxidase [Phycisphaerales bacterium]
MSTAVWSAAVAMIYDVIIIGSGTMGIAAAAELARRDAMVLALDQFSVPNPFGEHHGGARMFRSSYYEHPDYVPLLKSAFAGWKRLEGETGRSLFHVTGGLYLGPADGDLINGALRAGREHGLEIDLLDDVRARFPRFRPPDAFSALFETAAGVLRPEACIEAFAAVARDHGATIGTHERVTAVHPGDTEVAVDTDRARYRGRAAIITAGPWTQKLLSAIDCPAPLPPLTTTRQVIGWLRPEAAQAPAFSTDAGFPCWAVEDSPGSLHYGFPILPGDPDMRFARHFRGPACDPDAIAREADPEELRGPAEFSRSLFNDGPGMVLSRSGVCMYTNSTDSHFIIDRLPGSDNIILACGFSGHGFKFAPVMGEILADLALDGDTDHAIEFLSLARFA